MGITLVTSLDIDVSSIGHGLLRCIIRWSRLRVCRTLGSQRRYVIVLNRLIATYHHMKMVYITYLGLALISNATLKITCGAITNTTVHVIHFNVAVT
jgi:hypothetical protein